MCKRQEEESKETFSKQHIAFDLESHSHQSGNHDCHDLVQPQKLHIKKFPSHTDKTKAPPVSLYFLTTMSSSPTYP